MSSTAPVSPTDVAEIEINPLVHLVAPIAAIGATMLARRLMNAAYHRVTGNEAPAPRDPQVTFGRALVWTAVTAATAAVVEVAVYRLANEWGARN